MCQNLIFVIEFASIFVEKVAIQLHVLQAAANIANAASSNAHNEKYSSPYAKEALKQGMDIPWWEKVMGTRIKDGKPQLAKLEVWHAACCIAWICTVSGQCMSRELCR